MIRLFSHWNADQQKWQSNYENLGAWASVKSQPWPTQQFFSTLKKLPNNENYFSIENYTVDSNDGYYVVYYGTSNYLCEHYGLAFLPLDVVDKINAGRLKLMVVFVHETFDNDVAMREWYWTFCTLLTRLGIKRTNSVIFFTSTRSWGPMHTGEERASVVYYPWFEAEFQNSMRIQHSTPPTVDLTLKDRWYISLNFAPRQHRYLIVQYLYYKNLIKHGYVSWLNHGRRNWNEVLSENGYEQHGLGLRGQLTQSENADFFYWVRQFKLPYMELDPGDSVGPRAWVGAKEYYDRSRTELINETHFELYGNSFLTEKSFKSIFYGLPYIILGPQYQLKALKELGYHSYPDLWDESYDTMPATVNKIRHIGEQINNLCNWEDRRRVLSSDELQQRVQDNQQLFFNRKHAELIHNKLIEAWHA